MKTPTKPIKFFDVHFDGFVIVQPAFDEEDAIAKITSGGPGSGAPFKVDRSEIISVKPSAIFR